MAPLPLRRQIRHRYLGLDTHPRTKRPSRLLGHGPGSLHQVFKPGWPLAPTRGEAASRSSRMDGSSPGLRAPQISTQGRHGSLPRRAPGWQRLMSVADAFSKNSTTGAGVPPTPVQATGCYTPGSCLRSIHASTNYSTSRARASI